MKDMTSGNIPKHLVSYALPLILGNFFQLTYNAVDSIILGRFSGKEALAAVGIANPVMNILIFFIVGICIGSGILMSEFYGAKENDKLKKEISTTIACGFIFTVFVSIVCYLLIVPLLRLIRTPSELILPTSKYLRIVILGLVFTFFYNVFGSTLRAVGDSRTPIICVAVSAVLNGILDYILVAKLKLEMQGAAIATVASQAFSCFLIVGYVYLKEPLLAVKPKEFKIDKSLVARTLNYSWATALQQVVLYVGKLMIQSAVNPLGTDAIAAFNAGTKIDDFCYQPTQSIGHTITTFIAQNRGAGNVKREKSGFKWGLLLEYVYALIISTTVLIFRRELITLFAGHSETSVIQMGIRYLLIMASLYLMPATTNGVQAFFRGTGKMQITVVATTSQIVFRVLFSYILAFRFGTSGVAWACFFGWLAMLIYEIPVLFSHWKKI